MDNRVELNSLLAILWKVNLSQNAVELLYECGNSFYPYGTQFRRMYKSNCGTRLEDLDLWNSTGGTRIVDLELWNSTGGT